MKDRTKTICLPILWVILELFADLPKYSGPPPPPNRFGIMPGYRWDGVDRSNGFEKSIYAKMSDKKAVADLAYKWSVEDM